MITPSQRFRLRDPNAAVREAAALELVFGPEPELLPELLGLLSDSDGDVRRTAIQALGALNAPEALDGLCYSLLDPVPEVVEAAQGALVKLGLRSRAALEARLTHEEWPQRAAALRGLALMRPDPQSLVPLTNDPIWEVRGDAYLALGQTHSAIAMEALAKSLETEAHPQAREALISGLGLVQQPQARQLLLHALLDPLSPESAQVVASALQSYGSEIHSPLLNAGIWSPHPDVRALCAALLAQTNCPDLRSQLAPLLLDQQPQVRQTVAYAIYESDPSRPIWQYIAGIYDPDDHIFEGALLELLAYPGAGVGERLLEALDLRTSLMRSVQLVRALGELRYEPAGHVLIELLDQISQPVLLEAVSASLGKLGAWRAWHPLQRLLGHEDSGVRHTTIEALIVIDPEGCWQRLKELHKLTGTALTKLLAELATLPDTWGLLHREIFSSEDSSFRASILAAIKGAPPERLRPLLEEYLGRWPHPDQESFDTVLEVLEHAGLSEHLARCLLPWIEKRDAAVRSRVTRMLKPWAHTLKTELLAAATHEIWFVREAAMTALSASPDPDVLLLLKEALQDRDRDVRISAISLLGRIEAADIGHSLIDALETGYRDIRAAAAQALGRRRDTDAREALETALAEDESQEVRMAAAAALGELHSGPDPDLFELLEEAYEEEDDPDVQAACLKSLFSIDPPSAKTLVFRALKDEDEVLCTMAMQLLLKANWPIDGAMRTLENIIESGPEALRAQALALILPQKPELLGHWLKSADDPLRLACLRALQPEQITQHQIVLIMLLGDPSAQIRQETLRALAQVPELRGALATHARKESDNSVLQTLVELLTDLPLEEVLPVYQEILERPTPRVHTSVIWALAPVLALGGGQLLQSLLPSAGPGMRSQIFEVLAGTGAGSIPVLTELVDHWDRDLVLRAIRALGKSGPDAVPVLAEIWKREELAEQLTVLKACEELRHPETLPMLLMAARSTHDNLRAHAIEALILIGAEAREGLTQLLSENDPQIRFDAAHALAILEPDNPLWAHLRGASSALPSRRLRHLLALQNLHATDWLRFAGHLRKDPAYLVRRQFCETRSDESAFRRWLLRALQTEVLPVRQQAALELAHKPDENTQMQLMACWPKAPATLREILLAALASLGMAGQAMQGLEDSSALVRVSAACIAGSYHLTYARERLIYLLAHDTLWEVRAACAWALGRIGEEVALAALAAALRDGHPAVVQQAIIALTQLPGEQAAALLAGLLDLHDWDVFLREEVLRALANRRVTQAVPQLLQQANLEEDQQMRRRILDTLAGIGDVRSKGYLREIAAYGSDMLSAHAQRLLAVSD